MPLAGFEYFTTTMTSDSSRLAIQQVVNIFDAMCKGHYSVLHANDILRALDFRNPLIQEHFGTTFATVRVHQPALSPALSALSPTSASKPLPSCTRLSFREDR